ncbi:HIT family protein [Egicoccus halophilus]|uniref:HIT family protein n=1 Tax=Egicoccus halophilus TaxID=1670830 RepID=UPI00197A97A5|nr:HIT domain-containing protein [Egicoccus halophilus]
MTANTTADGVTDGPTDAADCIFCAIVAGQAPARVVHETPRTLAFLDVAPATRGHALVVPKAHARDLHDVAVDDLREVATTAQALARAAVARLGAAGVNLVQSSGAAAFQTVFHLHVHVIPRYQDDGLVLPWTPSPGDATTMEGAARSLREGLTRG